MTNSFSAAEVGDALRDRIETTLETIRPALQIDGGDVEFVGACGACPISWTTVKHGIERRMRASVPEVTEVQAV